MKNNGRDWNNRKQSGPGFSTATRLLAQTCESNLLAAAKIPLQLTVSGFDVSSNIVTTSTTSEWQAFN